MDATQTYQQRLHAHLIRLPRLSGMELDSEDALHQALEVLRTDAEAETRHTAASVLVSTTLLQNGKLDTLVVLCKQVQLVWRIARIYGLRPSQRQISYLCGNVGACMLIASSL